MKQPSTRIVIYSKDVMVITGRSLSGANKLLRKIRLQFGKKNRDFVTVDEFCYACGLTPEDVYPMLTG